MKPDLQRLDAVIGAAQHLRAAQADYKRKSDRARDAGVDCSPKKRETLATSMTLAAMDVERQWDTLHAALVDLGMSPPKDAAAYGDRVQHLSGFHDHAYQPAVPKAVKDRLTTAHPDNKDGAANG